MRLPYPLRGNGLKEVKADKAAKEQAAVSVPLRGNGLKAYLDEYHNLKWYGKFPSPCGVMD